MAYWNCNECNQRFSCTIEPYLCDVDFSDRRKSNRNNDSENNSQKTSKK